MRISRIFLIGILLFLTVGFAGCETPPEDRPPELYWPMPPAKPRIKFVDYIKGSLDAKGPREGRFDFKTFVFGRESEARFIKPVFVAVRDDVMYVSDVAMIHVYDFKDKEYRRVGGFLGYATGIEVGSDGSLYIGDTSAHRVYILKPGKRLPTVKVRPTDGFESVGGIALDEDNGRFFVVDTRAHRVYIFSLEGTEIGTLGQRGTAEGSFNFPYDVAVGPKGDIYVLDSGNFRVQIFDTNLNLKNAFGTVGKGIGQFARPKGIALDSEGHIYVVDAAFGNFQIFDSLGNVYLAVGESGVEPGQFVLPFGVDVDEDDKVYVVDQMNKRVQIFQFITQPGN